jgi:phosphoribosylformylglycinamidine synthase
MKQKYQDEEVFSPGTVIVTAVAHVENVRKIIEPVIQNNEQSRLFYVDFSASSFELGGSSFAQVLNFVGDKTPDVKDSKYFIQAFEAIQQLVKKDLIIAGHDISSGGLITALLEMTFPQNDLGLTLDLTDIGEKDFIKLLFSENPGVVLQVSDINQFANTMSRFGVSYVELGSINTDYEFLLKHYHHNTVLDINQLRKVWYKTSFHFDQHQSMQGMAAERFENFARQELNYRFPSHFTGKVNDYKTAKRPKAAIIREKGVNGDREMAYSLYHAGFEVKDVHMMDLINGTEDLSGVNMVVYVGGFSNSDVLGSAKGWAGAFLYNEKAKQSLDRFYARKDTLSLGICNGCQLMVELNLINPEHRTPAAMHHNDSHKFESGFINVEIEANQSVILKTLTGSRLGVWVAHGEGKFVLPEQESAYHIPVKYAYSQYPGNPNGSAYQAAAICSNDGRHLAMMPHLERSIFNWQWANYPENRKQDEITPWFEAFVNARNWILENQ